MNDKFDVKTRVLISDKEILKHDTLTTLKLLVYGPSNAMLDISLTDELMFKNLKSVYLKPIFGHITSLRPIVQHKTGFQHRFIVTIKLD